MTDQAASDWSCAHTLAAMVAQQHLLIGAMTADGTLVPVPLALRLPAERMLLAPPDMRTMLDLIVPADAPAAIADFERALATGYATGASRLRRDPDVVRPHVLLDARQLHGVLLTGFDLSAGGPLAATVPPDVALSAGRRPRTATVRKDAFANFTAIDERTTRMLGWTPEELVGTRSLDLVHPDDQQRAVSAWLELLSRRDSERVRLRHRRPDGSWLWLELENVYQPADDPAEVVVTTQMTDISDEMAAQEQARRQAQLLHRVAEALPVGILQLDTDLGVVYANARLGAILGLSAVTGHAELAAALQPADRDAVAAVLGSVLATADDEAAGTEMELTVRHAGTGATRVCSVTFTGLSDREGAPGVLICVNDVTESVRMREELTAQATFDDLTGAHNRASTMVVLARTLREEQGRPAAAVFLDLDHLKTVNDLLGHRAGDELLIAAADRIRSALRHDDVLGRLGGDEFLVVSRDVGSQAAALALATRVRDALVGPVQLTDGAAELSASLGVACSEPGMDAVELTRRADQAMYASKQDRRAEPVLFA
ncbi:diguanylate cyclase [Modestobacter sp. VKM Ac-2986]|uniref:GGDEF domain-containing protein n=1 Tax=Modestobacter sp. VKM Ac-2986 TaxID=3004140 RepID=UPI0022AA931D|nr:GGDEF domain-containing protein [Modestobacter sp. VKM Ac-2986]MCZ2829054.1 diguanylate cyclase [Modestobacter sp. VKM Ac-2986]